MKTLNNIQVIVFDIDNTLLDFRQCALKAMKKAFEKWKIPFKDEYLEVFLKINDKYWNQYEDGKITRDYLYKHRWQEIFNILNISCDGAEFEKDFVANLYHSHEKVKDVEKVLSYLKGKYDLVIASNSSYEEQKTRLTEAGLLSFFSQIFTSEEIGSAKPSHGFFEVIYQGLGGSIPKEKILMIGDSVNADIKGSRDFGFKTAL